ncbi:Signal peptidase complex subunit 3 [Fragariocoptes setiger]|uniref:Signal peptidase complex subunit 3 n=1 Tax=Fragariocoptes setiger TaxID=1670756 RepID=A0ABQ7SB92_9ACAR|nr:Signal peptidase complex subunit 3 [Fragariocoptes setiger]
MHTLFSRLNATFAFSLSVLAFLTLLFALSTSYKDYGQLVDVQMKVIKSFVRRELDYNIGKAHNDLGVLQYNLDADMEKLFDWNVKQLFVYLTANYQTKDNVVNQIVIWDHIINRGDPGKVNLVNKSPEYYMWDDGNGLLGNRNVTLNLSINIIPNAGFLQKALAPTSHTFQFPDKYADIELEATVTIKPSPGTLLTIASTQAE